MLNPPNTALFLSGFPEIFAHLPRLPAGGREGALSVKPVLGVGSGFSVATYADRRELIFSAVIYREVQGVGATIFEVVDSGAVSVATLPLEA